MKYASILLLLSSSVGIVMGCLPGLGLPGSKSGGCCAAAQPACGSPCGVAPPPVYVAAPLAPAPFAAYPQAPAAHFHPAPVIPFQPQPQQPFGNFRQPQQFQQVHNGYAESFQQGNFGKIQPGAVSTGGAYLAEPVPQVQPLPLLGQPVAYEKTLVVAPTQQQGHNLNTAQVLTKVMPASAVLDEHVVEPASSNNIVTSINTQTSYGDAPETFTQTKPQPQVNHPAVSSFSSSSSASSSAEHHPSHQISVSSASTSVESNEQRVIPESAIEKEIVQSFETTPYPQQVALQTVAPIVPEPIQPAAQPVPQPVQIVPQPQPAPLSVSQQVSYVAPHDPSTPQVVVEQSQTIQSVQPVAVVETNNVVPAVKEVTEAPSVFVHETKVVSEADRVETTGGSDYDQPSNIAINEQATVNELLASLEKSSPANNLDFNQVTVVPNYNQKTDITEDQGDDYDGPLNEDRKDVPTAEPSHKASSSNHQPVAVVPEETAPIIPQKIQPTPEVQHYQPQSSVAPVVETTAGYIEAPRDSSQFHLQPVAPAVSVQVTTIEASVSTAAPAIAVEQPKADEVVTQQVPLNPEPAVIQSVTELPIAEGAVQVLDSTSATPVSEFFENITSREDNPEEPSQPEPSGPPQTSTGNDYEEEKSVENKVSKEADIVPNHGEYGSKFAKVQGAGTKKVNKPIQIEAIDSTNPYARKR